MSFTTGEKLGPYEIQNLLGAGGMGEVYRARDTRLGRDVAVKVLPTSFLSDRNRLRRFEQEARAEGILNHPNVLTVHDVGTDGGTPYMVAELLEGESLRDRLRRGPFPMREAVGVALQIARGLAAAHEKGIVHRDLKPENVFLTQGGTAKILDFGVAKLFETADTDAARPLRPEAFSEAATESRVMTSHGVIVGTPAYMSPEQARGSRVDFRSDIFSLGVVLYEMISGVDPFRKTSAIDTISAILKDLPPPVHAHQGRTPAEVQRIVQKALAKEPSARYGSTADLVEDLQRLEQRLEGRLLAPARVVGLAGVAIAALGLVFWMARRSPPIAPTERDAVSVLVADLDNRTGDPVFDGALEQALQIGLEGAAFITSLDRGQARRQAASLPGVQSARLDEARARLVATSLGVKLVVAGSLELRSGRYALETRVVDPVSNETVTRAAASARSKADVLKAVDSVAVELRAELGDVKPQSAQALERETFTTASLDAMGSYARAQELHYQGKGEEAIQEYRKAVGQDPGFGRAYSGLAALLYNLGEREKSEEQFKAALAHLDRMTEREKYRTRGLYYILVRDYRKAVEEYETLLEHFPADSAGHSNLAFSYFLARDMERALVEGRRTVEIYPKVAPARLNLALYAMYAGDFETTDRESRAVLEQVPSYAKAYVALALSQLARGKVGEARDSYRKAEALSARGASFAAMGLADVALYEGRLAEAAVALEKGIAGDVANDYGTALAVKMVTLAHVRLLQGRKKEALATVDRALARSRQPNVAYPAALVLVRAGAASRAAPIAAELGRHLEADPHAYAMLIEGEMALARRDTREALQRFQEAKAAADTWLGRLALARAYLEGGAFAEAHSELELCLRRRGEATAAFLDDVPSYWYFPPVHYYLGRAQQGLGNVGAAASYEAFLAMKRNADSAEPLVIDVGRRLRRAP